MDKFCRYCGLKQAPSETWYLNPVWILVLTFTVLGPFALPLVWMSEKMSRRGKGLTTGIIVLYTIAAFYIMYLLWSLFFHHWMDLSRQLNEIRRY